MNDPSYVTGQIGGNGGYDELRGVARLHAAGLIRPSTTLGMTSTTDINNTSSLAATKSSAVVPRLNLEEFTSQRSTDPVSYSQRSTNNRIEDLYQHYMKTTMKHYVPKAGSRENLFVSVADQSRLQSGSTNSFYDA